MRRDGGIRNSENLLRSSDKEILIRVIPGTARNSEARLRPFSLVKVSALKPRHILIPWIISRVSRGDRRSISSASAGVVGETVDPSLAENSQ